MNKHFLLITLLTAFYAIFFTSCDKANHDCIVTFDSNGGSKIIGQTVVAGEKATEPLIAPTKEGSTFVGWFSYDNVFVKWDFTNEIITSDITLYAKWITIIIEDSDNKKTIPLIKRDDYEIFKNTVILYEDENYLVKSPLFYYLSEINNYYTIRVKGNNEYHPIIEQIISDGKKSNLLYSSSYFKGSNHEYILAYLLESGHCYFYDKTNKCIIGQVMVENWGFDGGPFAAYGGRRFYIAEEVIFLEIVDWIS